MAQEVETQIQQMDERHMKEFDEFRVSEEASIEKSFRFKPSASLLQQQTIFKRLVQLKKFKEAH